MSDSIRSRVRQVLEGLVHDPEELAAVLRGEVITDAVTIDSMAFLELVVRLENEFGVSFGYEDIEGAFRTIDSLVAFLAGKSASAG